MTDRSALGISGPVGDDGVVRRAPRVFLRLEGAVLLALSILAYARYGSSWWLFALLLLAPDLGALGYLAGTRVGASTYNALHTYAGPAPLVAIGAIVDSTTLLSLGFIWFAHLGMDRALGFGPKYADAFGHTHLGFIGRGRRREP
jgi:Domain of unknown function (DUF4260)